MEDSTLIELDRKWRGKVRDKYYLRREDFESERGYDDYLEEVEELVEDLINDATQAAAVARLAMLEKKWKDHVKRNLGEYSLERKRRDEELMQEKAARAQAAQERREADQRAAELLAQERAAQQQKIRAGTTTVGMARAALSKAKEAVQQQVMAEMHRPTGAAAPPPAAAPSAPPPPVFVQPLDAAAAEARRVADRKNDGVKSSIYAKAENYESNAALAAKVRAAGGYARDQWRERYRMEAFSDCGGKFWAR